MTEEEFYNVFITASTDVADKFYPKGNPRRGEYLRDQGVLFSFLLTRLREDGFITGPKTIYSGAARHQGAYTIVNNGD